MNRVINNNLKESEENFRSIVEQSLMGITVLQDGVFKYFNERIVDIYGYSAEEVKSWAPNEFEKLIHPEDKEFVMEQARKKQEGDPDVVNQYPFRIIRKNGEVRWLEIFSKTINYKGAPADLAMTNDITDKIKAEQDLRESEVKFRNIAEQSLVGIFIIQDGKYKYINEQLTEMDGYSIEEMKSWPPHEQAKIIHPEDREFVMRQALKKQEGDPDVVNQYTYRIIRKNGEVRWREIFSKTINYESAPADLAMVYDITDKIKAEQDLKESEEKFRTITEQSLMGIFILQDGKFKYINERLAEMSGYSIEEMKSWDPNEFAKIIHPEDREFVMEQARKKQIGDPNIVNHYNFRIIRKDGEIRWRETFSKTINYESAPADLVITYDITDKVKAEQQLKESEEKFSTAFNSNALSMCITSMEDGRLIEANDVFLNFLGSTKEEVIGTKVTDLWLWNNKRIRDRVIKLVKENRNLYNVESSFRSKSGELKYGLFSIVQIMLNNKPYLLTIINDITPRKLAEKKLKKSKEKYHQAYNQAEFYKDLFIHDINNTLQSLYSSIQLIDMDIDEFKKKDDIKEFMEIMYRQIKRGINLISNVRKLSLLEDREISIEEVDLLDALDRSIKFVKSSFKDKKVEIKIDTFSNTISILANDLLQDVFENILINSIKYNRNVVIEIMIKISLVEQDNVTYCKLEFIDNGIGIEDIRKEKVLSRVDIDSKTTYGMGLGLSLVKKIIGNYKGKIWIEDKIKGDYSKGTNVVLLMKKGDS
ncbi:MAG: PAS domain S-box protein [Promethearchaeota archaeon]